MEEKRRRSLLSILERARKAGGFPHCAAAKPQNYYCPIRDKCLTLYYMQVVENPAGDTLSKWADEQVVLDYWFCQCWITELGMQGREKTGQGIVTHLRNDMFAFQFMEGTRLELRIRGEVIV